MKDESTTSTTEATIPPKFEEFPHIPRLSREIIVTEKIDGTNACIHITDGGLVFPGSRTRWITTESDNAGFARWVKEHLEELRVGLGPGTHFGEWWGRGIQRGYGQTEKIFSLFNTTRWTDDVRPKCCRTVPVLYTGMFDTAVINETLNDLKNAGSAAAPGFMQPEGVVVFHVGGNLMFKKTIDKDDKHKSEL
jgi:hypothetical protein